MLAATACAPAPSDSASTSTTSPNPSATSVEGGDPSTTVGTPLLPASGDPAHQALANAVGGGHGIAVAAVTDDDPATISVATLGPLETGVAWSTIKVPMAMAVIEDGAGSALGPEIGRALTASDNEAAMRLWEHLGGGEAAAQAVTRQLRAGGDERTETESAQVYPPYSPYGQTRWALAAQARFALSLPCSAAGTEVLTTMRDVVADQRWGLGSVGTDVAFKGGWGPGTDPGVAGGYLVRQFGVLTVDGRDLGVAIAAQPADGTFDSGTSALTAMALWLADNVAAEVVTTTGPCDAFDEG